MTAVAKQEVAVRTPGALVQGQVEASAMLDMIERAARDPQVDIDKLEKLVAMKERMMAQAAEQAFNAALSQAQSEMRPVAADSSNPQTRSKYASYLALDRAMRPVYTRHGFSLSFDTGDIAATDVVRVLCHVAHREGHTRTYHVDMPADGKGAKGGDVMTKTHAAGSAMSYGQRYLLKLIFNIAVGDDDDGNAASSEPITEAQRDELRALIVETGADIGKFCAYMKVERVEDIPANRFGVAKAALEKKRK